MIGLADGSLWRVGRFLAVVAATRATLRERQEPTGGTVLVAASDLPRTVAAVCACLYEGHSAAVVDARMPATVLSDIVELVRPCVSLVDDRRTLTHLGSSAGHTHVISDGPVWRRLAPWSPKPEPPVACAAEGDALVFLTSGSSGTPKGVRLSRQAVVTHLHTLSSVWSRGDHIRMGSLLPLHHADGLVQGALLPLLYGGFTWLAPSGPWDGAGPIGEAIHRHDLTHALLTPAHLARFLANLDKHADDFRGRAFKFIISTAAPLPDEVWRRSQTELGVAVANVYGLTETVAGSCFAIPGTDSHIVGTVGKPVDCEVRAVDEAGVAVPIGATGQLQIRGAHLFTGYFGASSADRFAPDGWLQTGDLGRIDGDGLVRINGRLSSSFKSGAVLVNPDATTAALRQDERVLDAASLGTAAPTMSTMLVSAVVLKPNNTTTAAELLGSLRERLPPHQIPRHLLIVDELPLGPSGKPLGDRLQALFRERLSAVGVGQSGWVAVQEIAARAFATDPTKLAPSDTPASIATWDSFGHLAFISALESALARPLELAEIKALRSLADAVQLVENNAS